MARKKVIDLNADSTIQWEKKGQKLSGYYIGFKTVTTDFGPSKLHVLSTASGSIGCWGSAQLDSKLGTVEKGSMVWIVFAGKTAIAGGKTMKNFEVDFDDEDKIDVGGAMLQYDREGAGEEQEEEQSDSDASNEQQDVDQDEPDAEEDAETEQNPAKETFAKKGAAVGPTPEMKAKAQAFLNKARAANKPARTA